MDPATPLLALSKAVSSRSKPFLLRRGAVGGRLPAAAPLLRRFPVATAASSSAPRGLGVPGDLLLFSLARLAIRGPGPRAAAAAAAPWRWFASVSAASPLASGGPPRGGGGAGNGDGGGGGGGGGWKQPRASQGAGVTEEAPGKGADVIVLDVGVWLFLRLLLGCSKKSKKKHMYGVLLLGWSNTL